MLNSRIICKKDVKTFSGVRERFLILKTGQILNRSIDRSTLRDINDLVNWVDKMEVLKQQSEKSSSSSCVPYQSSDEDLRSTPSSSLSCSSLPLDSSSTSSGNNDAREYTRTHTDEINVGLKPQYFLGFDTSKKISRDLYLKTDKGRQSMNCLYYHTPEKKCEDELYSLERSMEHLSLKRRMEDFPNENPKKPRCSPVSSFINVTTKLDFSPSKLLHQVNRKRKRDGFSSEESV